jgi:hypothetical protein
MPKATTSLQERIDELLEVSEFPPPRSLPSTQR